jgi:hypothetical protein
MITGRDDCHPSTQKIDRDSTSDSAARRRIFAIHDYEVDTQLFLHPWDRFDYRPSPGFPNNVA